MDSPLHVSGNNDQLFLKTISCRNFRVYSSFICKDMGPLTIFAGPNAVGKTSILEAIQLMTALESFRSSRSAQLLRWGESEAEIKAEITGERRSLSEELIIQEGKRTYYLNGKKKGINDLKGLLPAVTFTPDDLQIAKGSPAQRRRQIDSLGMQISKNYRAVRLDYEKLIKQKNQALKNEMSDEFIDSIDEVLVKVGVQVLQHRLYLVERLQPVFQQLYRSFSHDRETAQLIYIPCWLKNKNEEQDVSYEFDKATALAMLTQQIAERREVERSQQRSLVGPHADEVVFFLNGHDAVHFASQGQQRSIVLAYKIAEAVVIQDILDQKPLLLLDDVMSELDEQRRSTFMEFISSDIQTIITTTNLAYFSQHMLNQATVVELSQQTPSPYDVSRETKQWEGIS